MPMNCESKNGGPQAGRLIVFEGGEGSGKTTQLQRSHLWLSQEHDWSFSEFKPPLLLTREPGGTKCCQAIRQILLTPTADEVLQDRAELLLYAADRAQHVDGLLRPALAAGTLVLCDRYTDSTVAYQGYGRGLSLALIDQLNQIATGGLQPDLTLWLAVDPAVGLARAGRRGAADRIEQDDLAFHQRVQQGFEAIAQAHPQRVVRIDAKLPEATVAQQIQRVLGEYLGRWYGKRES